MSSHVYPYAFSFKSIHSGTLNHIVLLDTTRSRKKDWVIRVKGNWDGEWRTVVNCTERFGQFMAATIEESKDFVIPSKPVEAVYGTATEPRVWKETREAVGGKPGYAWGTFYWNVLRWCFVEALRKSYVSTMEDEVCSLTEHFTKKLEAIPAPDQIEGKPFNPDFACFDDWRKEAFSWKYAGLDYSFDYETVLAEALKPLNFKIICNF